MISGDPRRRRVVAAAIAASLLMLIFGLACHVLAARLGTPGNETPIDLAAVEQFPMQIGGWMGQDVPMDEAIVRATGTDAHINRRYSRSGNSESIALYVACGTNARSLMVHRPEVCYISAGLTLMDRRSVELPLTDGSKLPCSVFEFLSGGLDTKKTTVLCYFIVDGQYCGDLSLLRSRAWRGSGTVHHAAQVQIGSRETPTADSGMRLVSAFAVDSAPLIARLFKDREKDPNSGEFHEQVKKG